MSRERRSLSGGVKPPRSRADSSRSGAVPTERAPAPRGPRSPSAERSPVAGEVRDIFGDFSEQTGANFG